MGKAAPSNGFAIKKYLLILVLAAAGGGWWLWTSDEGSEWKDHLYSYVDNKDMVTLESRFTPQQVIAAHRQELVGKDKKELQEPIVQYYPYLLLDVKYTEENKPREGALIWGLTNGEIVLNTETWDTTHGLKDCLECGATSQDFKIIKALARHGGAMTMEELQKELKLEREFLDPMVANAKQKHLVIQKGSSVQLHFENPKFLVQPQTKINQKLVSKPTLNAVKIGKTYSRSEIIAMAKTAFGNDFKIRSEQEIFLPVYKIDVLNPDGSVYSSQWNALTGQQYKR